MGKIQTQRQKMDTVRSLLTGKGVQEQIAMVMPKHLTADRIIRITMTSIQRTPKLADCTPASLLGSVLTCTQLGLEPDSASGRAYLIPYGNTCTLIVGYRGLMDLARRSGDITSLEARVVCANDVFEYELGTSPRVTHRPVCGDRGQMTHVYAVAMFKAGGSQFEVMTKADVEQIRNRSKASKSGPWTTDYDEMAKKTVMRRLCKYLPSSPELSTAVSLDENAERGIPQGLDFIDLEPTATNAAPQVEIKPTTLDDIAKPLPETEPVPA